MIIFRIISLSYIFVSYQMSEVMKLAKWWMRDEMWRMYLRIDKIKKLCIQWDLNSRGLTSIRSWVWRLRPLGHICDSTASSSRSSLKYPYRQLSYYVLIHFQYLQLKIIKLEMDRALPEFNRILHKKWVSQNRRIHK